MAQPPVRCSPSHQAKRVRLQLKHPYPLHSSSSNLALVFNGRNDVARIVSPVCGMEELKYVCNQLRATHPPCPLQPHSSPPLHLPLPPIPVKLGRQAVVGSKSAVHRRRTVDGGCDCHGRGRAQPRQRCQLLWAPVAQMCHAKYSSVSLARRFCCGVPQGCYCHIALGGKP